MQTLSSQVLTYVYLGMYICGGNVGQADINYTIFWAVDKNVTSQL